MSKVSKCVLLVCYGISKGDEEKISRDGDITYSDFPVIILRSKGKCETVVENVTKLSDGHCFDIEDEDLIAGFYRAKVKLDEMMSSDLEVIGKSEVEMTTLCKVFFTPAFQWRVSSLKNEKEDRDCDDLMGVYTKKLKDYLSKIKTNEIQILRSELIPEEMFNHGFSTRKGGLSTVPGMKSLNMVYTDAKRDPRIVIEENKKRLASVAKFDPEQLHVARAVHGNTVHEIGADIPESGYDGVTSNKTGVTCAAPGADCVILLFADPVTKSFAAVHSGWKGTLANIPTEAVRKMKTLYGSKSEDILVVMGPCICRLCFEFGEKESEHFAHINPNCVVRSKEGDKPTVDLKLAIRTLLENEGVLPGHIDDTDTCPCTTENPHLLFSYRRDGRPFGNQIGFIGLKN